MEDACPASIRMSAGYPNKSNPAAELGTAAHALGETCIALGVIPHDMIGLTVENHEVTEKMADDVSLYVNVINDLSGRYGVKPLLEQRVVMSSLGRTDVYGTSDCIFIVPGQRLCHVIDYKNGYGLVEADDNSQGLGYATATLDTYDLWDKVDTITVTIVQPNGGHISGPVRNATYTVAEVAQWREKYRRSVTLAEDPGQKPRAGEWCHWCPAQANCRARMEQALKIAYTDVPLAEISLGELEVIYKEIGSAKKFLDMVADRMLDEARNGHNMTDYKLVKSYPRAKVEDKAGFIAAAKACGVNETDLYNNPLLIGKTKAKKLLPKQIVDKYYLTPPPSTTLVEMNDNRPAVRVSDNSAKGVFSNRAEPAKSAVGVFSNRQGA